MSNLQPKVGNKLSIFSWSMYDFANTMFAMNIITLYFALWVTVDKGGEDLLYSWALSGSMLLAAFTAPILGTLSDKLNRRLPFLISFTLACCLATAMIGLIDKLIFGLILFAIANYCFQVADVFYNSLLPQISKKATFGRVSGYGVGLGYCGTIAGLLLVSPFVLKFGRQAAFIPTAVFFLVFALPCFIFVKETKKAKENIATFPLIRETFSEIKNTFLNVRKYSNLFIFLIAIFIAFNAVNTIYIFMSVYIKKVIGFSDATMIVFYIISSIFAILGSFVCGFISDAFGAKRTLTGILLLWCVTIILAIITFNPMFFWIIGPLAGISLGATWTSGRALAVTLAPAEMVGEVFGFYGFVGKTASILGPIIWGSSIWLFKPLGLLKYRIAVFILLIFLVIGTLILQKVPNVRNK